MRQWSLPVVAWVSIGVALAAIGSVVGMKLPWGVKNPQIVEGVALLHNEETGLTSFEGDGGESTAFSAHEVQWHATGESGTGNPPCLVADQEARVTAGLMWVRGPDGGAHLQLVWLDCP